MSGSARSPRRSVTCRSHRRRWWSGTPAREDRAQLPRAAGAAPVPRAIDRGRRDSVRRERCALPASAARARSAVAQERVSRDRAAWARTEPGRELTRVRRRARRHGRRSPRPPGGPARPPARADRGRVRWSAGDRVIAMTARGVICGAPGRTPRRCTCGRARAGRREPSADGGRLVTVDAEGPSRFGLGRPAARSARCACRRRIASRPTRTTRRGRCVLR